jgi:hypothetical protein
MHRDPNHEKRQHFTCKVQGGHGTTMTSNRGREW